MPPAPGRHGYTLDPEYSLTSCGTLARLILIPRTGRPTHRAFPLPPSHPVLAGAQI